MSDNNVAPGGGDGEAIAVVTPADPSATYSSTYSAGKALAEMRWAKAREQQGAQDSAAPADPPPDDDQNSAQADNSDPPKAATADNDQAQTDPADTEPPIDPPRSWSKDAKERWANLPRDVQEVIADREQDRDRELRRAQNKAAEGEKSLTDKLTQAESLRAEYEQALPILLQTLQQSQQGEFADVRTMQDVERLAREDWPRYVLWDAQQKKIAAVQQQMQAAQQRQQVEKGQKWATFAKEQDGLLLEKAPELSDQTTAQKVAKSAASYLEDLGFDQSELADLWNGGKEISLRDHRLQLLIRDAIRFREAKAAAPAKASKPVPQVVRPGTAQTRGETRAAELQALESKLAKSGSWKDAAALLVQRRALSR